MAVTAWKNCSAPIGDAGFRCTQLAYHKAVEGVKSYADVTPELVAATNAAVQKSGVSIAVDGTYVELSYADEDKRRAEVAKALSQGAGGKSSPRRLHGSETTNMAKRPPSAAGKRRKHSFAAWARSCPSARSRVCSSRWSASTTTP